jgi:hypothetical protein
MQPAVRVGDCGNFAAADSTAVHGRRLVQLRKDTIRAAASGAAQPSNSPTCQQAPHKPPGRTELQQQVAQQASALLHIAYVLQLQPLIDVLHNFVSMSSAFMDHLLEGVLDKVSANAVLNVALGSSRTSKEAYLTSVLTQPCGFVVDNDGCRSILEPL